LNYYNRIKLKIYTIKFECAFYIHGGDGGLEKIFTVSLNTVTNEHKPP